MIDPALDFWLRATEAEGALHEQVSGAAVVLLPAPLSRAFALPDEVTVTADPEVAREDGALLLVTHDRRMLEAVRLDRR